MAIVNCGGTHCKSEYQDKLYGRGKRVANQKSHQGQGSKEYRCTVCLAINDESKVDKSFVVRED